MTKYNKNINACMPIYLKKIDNWVVERFSQLIFDGSAAGTTSTLWPNNLSVSSPY